MNFWGKRPFSPLPSLHAPYQLRQLLLRRCQQLTMMIKLDSEKYPFPPSQLAVEPHHHCSTHYGKRS
ncbi:MAG: hypothetical protein KDE56_30835, partial [Anaerolineales bacterium]|nr:hypothetical protein [Anaerolineales bacterium]